MFRSSFVLLAISAATASAAEVPSPPVAAQQWQTYANCAAGYQANWQDRLTDPRRTHDMSNMIHDQSEDYKKAATGFYQSEQKASPEEASRNVADYLAANIGGFLAMDAAGTLEAYLDTCPQLEANDTK
jgi:hypothetical protein